MGKNIIYRCLLLGFLLSGHWVIGFSQDEFPNYKYEQYDYQNNILNYRVLYPSDFDDTQTYPLLLFLHGMGERGSDNETQLTHGARLLEDSISRYPAIVLFPQCPETDYWANLSRPDRGGASRKFTFHTDDAPNPSMAAVISLIDEYLDRDYIDDSRFYVSGLSMGGMGVWELLWRIPEKIAGAAPICGGGPPKKGKEMTEVPIWIFHGAKDNVVNPSMSLRMLESVQSAGGKARLTMYPEVQHNAWDYTFQEPDFLFWLFSKRKN